MKFNINLFRLIEKNVSVNFAGSLQQYSQKVSFSWDSFFGEHNRGGCQAGKACWLSQRTWAGPNKKLQRRPSLKTFLYFKLETKSSVVTTQHQWFDAGDPSREAVEWNFDFYSIANKFIMKEKMMAVCISIMVYSGDGCWAGVQASTNLTQGRSRAVSRERFL